MLVKHPKSQFGRWLRKGVLVVFVLEAVAFGATYFGWTKLNRDRDTRKYFRDNYPILLETYYRTGELLQSENKIREVDAAYWNAEAATELNSGSSVSKDQQFMNILEAASKSNKPLYRQSKDELDKSLFK